MEGSEPAMFEKAKFVISKLDHGLLMWRSLFPFDFEDWCTVDDFDASATGGDRRGSWAEAQQFWLQMEGARIAGNVSVFCDALWEYLYNMEYLRYEYRNQHP